MQRNLAIKGLSAIVIIIFLDLAFAPSIHANKNTVRELDDYPIRTNLFNNYEQKIRFLMRIGHIPSLSVCIIKNSSIVWSDAFGFSDFWHRKEATVDTIYLVGSVSKCIIGTAIMRLYDQGIFNLDDDINNYSSFPLRNPHYPDTPITFRMLLAHQSSLLRGQSLVPWGLSVVFKSYSPPERPYPWVKEALTPNGRCYDPTVWGEYPPGLHANYSAVNFILLAYLIEQMTDQLYEDYCTAHLFEPLEMKDTAFHPDYLEKERFAVPYLIPIVNLPLRHWDAQYANPSGGLRTTVEDLANFLILHMTGGVYNGSRILEEETIELMHTIQYPESQDPTRCAKYGLGWMEWLNSTRVGHSGTVFGGKTVMTTKGDLGVIYVMNCHPGIFCPPLLEEVFVFRLFDLLMEFAEEFCH